MAKEKGTQLPAGYKKVETKIPFVDFKIPGDMFEGTFLETKEITSSKFGNTQTVWICADKDGELKQVPEKASMQDMRLKLQKGTRFAIVYIGDQPNKKGGKPWKEFEFGMAE